MSARAPGTVRPSIAAISQLEPVQAGELEPEPTVSGALVQAGAVAGDVLSHGLIEHSRFEGVRAIEARGDGLVLRHVELSHCDWSNTSFESISWSTTILDGCKLTGALLNRGALKDVWFRECRAEYVQLQQAKLEGAVFEDCHLQHAFFNDATLPGTVFVNCDLTEADFTHARLKGCDFRRSVIEGIRIAPEQLRGVIVTPDQALYLAGALGLDIRD